MKNYYSPLFFILLSVLSLQLNAQTSETSEVVLDGNLYNLSKEYNNRGFQKYEQGNYAEAEKLFLKALELDSFDIIIYENLINTYKKLSDYKNVVNCYALAKQIFPDDAEIYYYSGDVLQQLNRFPEAIEDYNRAILLSENYEDNELLYLYYFNRGNSFLKLKNYEMAVRNFNQSTKLNPYHYPSFANRGMALYNLKDKDAACKDWTNASELGYNGTLEYIRKYCQ